MKIMNGLTGSESTALIYLTQFPNATNRENVLKSLNGQALEIAKAIIDIKSAQDPKVQAAAEAIIKWAERK